MKNKLSKSFIKRLVENIACEIECSQTEYLKLEKADVDVQMTSGMKFEATIFDIPVRQKMLKSIILACIEDTIEDELIS